MASKHAFIVRASIRAGWVLAALALLPVGVQAKGYSPAVAGSTVSWTNATIGKAQLSSAGATVAVTAPVSISIASGISVQAVASAAITGAAAAGAWGAAAGAIGAIALAALPAVKEWMNQSGVKVKPDGSLTKPDPEVCTKSPCYVYYDHNGGGTAAWHPTIGAAASSRAAYATANDYNYEYSVASCGVSTCSLKYQFKASSDYYSPGQSPRYLDFTPTTSDAAPAVGADKPVSLSDAVSLLSASAPSAALVQALIDANFPPVVAPQSITGPATVAGANTVKLGLDGASQSETCKYFVEYFPSNIKAHPECTTVTTIPERTESKTVITTNPDGSTSSSVITTTTPPSTKTESITKDKVDKADRTECEEFPDRLSCAQLDTPTGEIPKSTVAVSYSEQTLFGAGSCPADLSVNIGLMHRTVKVWDWQKTCELALPLRALIISLASFAALFIVMPGANRS